MGPSSRTIILFQNRRVLGRISVAVNPERDFQRGRWSFSKGKTECRKSKKRTFPSLFLYDWSWKNVADSWRTEAKKLPCFGQKLVRTTVTMGNETPPLLFQQKKRKEERKKEIKKRRAILLKYTTPLLKTVPPLGGPLIQKNGIPLFGFSFPIFAIHPHAPASTLQKHKNRP